MQFFFNFSEDIPEQFYMSENNQPPTECSVCGNEFGDQHFFIEKAFQKTHDGSAFQLTFEYAVCERCKKDMLKSVSKESMKTIQHFATNMGVMPVFGDSGEMEIDLDYVM